MSKQADVLVVGGGFAGFSCFLALDRKHRKVTILTNRNHFLFTPLLPQAAVGTVEVRSIVEPIYSFAKRGGEVVIGEALDLLPDQRKLRVKLEGGRIEEIEFVSLVITTGAQVSTFGIRGVLEHCFFMKEMKDARALREKVPLQFEKAAHLSGESRKKALRFVVVGAGATGVEVACEIDDLIQHDLRKHFPRLAREAVIQIIEATEDILPAFDRTLAHYAQTKLKQKGILIRTELPVQAVEKDKVILPAGESVEAETIIWATGNSPHLFTRQAAKRLGVQLRAQGRFPVDSRLRIMCPYSELYALGDCAWAEDQKGHPLPATAQVAMRQGMFLGHELTNRTTGRFQLKSMGMLASLGSGSAIADLGFLRFKGVLAWWFWKAAYLTRLVSLRNKVSVVFDWIKIKIFGRNTARIDF